MDLGKFVFQQNSCSESYIYTWRRDGYLHDPMGLYTGMGRLGKGGAAALKPDLAKESVLAGIPISPPTPGRG